MILRAVFVADGSSDLPLALHLGALCLEHGLEVRIATPDMRRLGPLSRSVADRLSAVVRLGDPFDLAFVHRDAEGQPPELRRTEITDGAAKAGIVQQVVPVVPVRMTEAWLVLDEAMIRTVAGKPEGKDPLELPKWHQAESLPDPKRVLREALVAASQTTGRRRESFLRDFSRHRRTLLDRLDRNGPVAQLQSWKQMVADIGELAKSMSENG